MGGDANTSWLAHLFDLLRAIVERIPPRHRWILFYVVVAGILEIAAIYWLSSTPLQRPPPAVAFDSDAVARQHRDVEHFTESLDSVVTSIDGRSDYWSVFQDGQDQSPSPSMKAFRTSLSLFGECTLTTPAPTGPQLYDCHTSDPAPFKTLEAKRRAYEDAVSRVVPPPWLPAAEDSVRFVAMNPYCNDEKISLRIIDVDVHELVLHIDLPHPKPRDAAGHSCQLGINRRSRRRFP